MTEKSFLDKTLEGMGKPAEVSRASIGSALGLKTPRINDLLSGSQDYSSQKFIQDIEDKYNVDLTAGGRDPNKQTKTDSVINFIRDFAIEVGTDPLSLLSFGSGSAIKGIGKQIATGAGVGAGLGLLSSDMTDPQSAIPSTLVGATGGAMTVPAIKGAKHLLGKGGDALADAYYAATRPEVFEAARPALEEAGIKGISQAKEIATGARDKLRGVRNDILGLSEDYLDQVPIGLEDQVLGEADQAFQKTIKIRNQLEDQALKAINKKNKDNALDTLLSQYKNIKGFDPLSASDAELKDLTENIVLKDKFDEMVKPVKDLTQKQLNVITTKANTQVGKEIDRLVTNVGDPEFANAVNGYRKLNRDIIEHHNKFMTKRNPSFEEIVPIDFHTFEVLSKDDIKKMAKNKDFFSQEGFLKRTGEAPIKTGGLSGEERIRMGADNVVKYYMTSAERTADKFVNAVLNSDAPDAMKGLEGALDKFDDFTSFLKKQHLLFTHSWLVNNYSENAARAYLVGGEDLAWNTLMNQSRAAFRDSSDNLMRDLIKITDPKLQSKAIKFEDDMAEAAWRHGAVEDTFFNEAFVEKNMSPEMLVVKKGKDEAASILKRRENLGMLSTAANGYDDFLKNTVGRTGQAVEGAARLTVFKHHLDMLVNGGADDILMDRYGIGGKLVRDTIKEVGHVKAEELIPQLGKIYDDVSNLTGEMFFNYKNVSLFEDKVMKRVFPYYTFFSRSIPMWAEQIATNPAGIAGISRVHRNIGDELSEQERLATPEYLLEAGGRKTGKTGKGLRVTTLPSLSLFDTKNLLTGDEDYLSKLHPALRLAHGLKTNTGPLGGKLFPSTRKEQSVPMLGSDIKFRALGVGHLDPQGNPQNSSDLAAAAMFAQQQLLPVGAFDTAVKLGRSAFNGGLIDELANLGPVKTKVVSPQRQSANVRQNMKTKRIEFNKLKKKALIDQLELE